MWPVFICEFWCVRQFMFPWFSRAALPVMDRHSKIDEQINTSMKNSQQHLLLFAAIFVFVSIWIFGMDWCIFTCTFSAWRLQYVCVCVYVCLEYVAFFFFFFSFTFLFWCHIVVHTDSHRLTWNMKISASHMHTTQRVYFSPNRTIEQKMKFNKIAHIGRPRTR